MSQISGGTNPGSAKLPLVGLLASEMCSRGGIQSFMLRIAEVMGRLVREQAAAGGVCISLNDSIGALRSHPSIPPEIPAWGANRSKSRLILRALWSLPRVDVLFVGHAALAPLAHALKAVGRVGEYHVILHGIEAWKPLPRLQRSALGAATRVVATTHYTANQCAMQNALDVGRFAVIPLCVDEREIPLSRDFRLNGEFKLLCVARQDASEMYKGFEHIFEAMLVLRSTRPGIHLNLVGVGDDQPRLRQLVQRMDIANQVTFWGALSDGELAVAYRDCDAYVMPSGREGFGIVFLEAMRFAKPCIGGNHGGTPDVIEHGSSGYLVEYGDSDALGTAIARLHDDPCLRERLGARGHELFRRKFSAERFYENFLAVVTDRGPCST